MTQGKVPRNFLIDVSDEELRVIYRQVAQHVSPSYHSVVEEMDRRGAARTARENRILSLASIAISVAAILIAAFK